MNKVSISKAVLLTGLLTASQFASAHTRLQVPEVNEKSASHGSDYNNLVIAHGCRNLETGNSDVDTIGTVVVFPDGVDSSIFVDGEASEGSLSDYVTNWGSPVAKIQDKDIFSEEEEIKDSLGNVLGFWSAGGPGLKGGLTGLLPFRTSGVTIDPASCAKSVKFIVAVADVCEMTDLAGINDETAFLWTPAVGSVFDGTEDLNGYDSPASLTVIRTSEMPTSCGEGVEVMVKPSAAQLDRDMSVEIGGVQVWPQP